jgi:hypothetical protein
VKEYKQIISDCDSRILVNPSKHTSGVDVEADKISRYLVATTLEALISCEDCGDEHM